MVFRKIRKIFGRDYVQLLEERYTSIEELKQLIEDDPNNELYTSDLEDWQYFIANPNETIDVDKIRFTQEQANNIKRIIEKRRV